MEKSRDYVESSIFYKGENRKIQISPDGYEVAKLPEHPATPLYTVVFQDDKLIELIGADRIQVPATGNPDNNGGHPLLQNAPEEANNFIKDLYKTVRKHHEVFNPESV